jgi:hexosaminidase
LSGIDAERKHETCRGIARIFYEKSGKILKTKGKNPRLGRDLEGGIAPEATVMSWRGIEGGIEAAKLGHNVVMTPSPYVYIDFMQSDRTLEPPIYATLRLKKCYDFEPIPEGVDGKFILEDKPTFGLKAFLLWRMLSI